MSHFAPPICDRPEHIRHSRDDNFEYQQLIQTGESWVNQTAMAGYPFNPKLVFDNTTELENQNWCSHCISRRLKSRDIKLEKLQATPCKNFYEKFSVKK